MLTLGYGEASTLLNLSPGQTGSFAGQSVDDTAILIAQVRTGDADLNGRIDADDYFAIDSNYNKSALAPAYGAGDFNYDGKLNGDDYFLIAYCFGQDRNPYYGSYHNL
jgi:hypothetical protein